MLYIHNISSMLKHIFIIIIIIQVKYSGDKYTLEGAYLIKQCFISHSYLI